MEEDNYKLMIEDYAKYPFLESFTNVAGNISLMQLPIQRLLETNDGGKALDIAKNRILTALSSEDKEIIYDKNFQIKVTNKIPNILAFGIARMIISCTTQYIIDKFANSEANRSMQLLNSESPHIRSTVLNELKFTNSKKIPLSDYISLNMIKYGKEYKLINREIIKGNVIVDDINLILKEKMIQKIKRKLPLDVKPDVKELFKPIIKEIMNNTSSGFGNNDLGEVNIENFPPCMNNIISMIKRKENPTHFGRFAIVSFCNKIGMSDTEILTLFQTVKDFEVSTSLYQVEHITGKRGGTVYASPACAAMKTNNLCRSGTDTLCNRVKHPLGYYSSMQRRKKK